MSEIFVDSRRFKVKKTKFASNYHKAGLLSLQQLRTYYYI